MSNAVRYYIMENQLKTIRDKVEHLVFAPRFNDDELNYLVLGSINERAEEIVSLIDEILSKI